VAGRKKPESSQRYNFQGWSGGALPLQLRRRRNLHHQPSKFPALNAPERAVVVLYANKMDFSAPQRYCRLFSSIFFCIEFVIIT
jgi:hypothetical protein